MKSKIIDLPKIVDSRGNLSIIEENKDIPFKIERTYWIYDVPGGETRGGHAYRENEEFIIALSGSFDVVLDNGEEKQIFSLNRSYYGLYVPKGIWRQMLNFSTNSLALVLASTIYDEEDYIREYDEFLSQKQINNIIGNQPTIPTIQHLKGLRNQYENKSVYDCSIIELPKIANRAGNITPIEGIKNIPFELKRVFYSYDIPGGESRGAHAHKICHQFLVAASGAFEVLLNDGRNKRTVLLNRPFYGLHIPPGIWASEKGFSSGAVCLVLASEVYNEDDYIRTYQIYLEYLKTNNSISY